MQHKTLIVTPKTLKILYKMQDSKLQKKKIQICVKINDFVGKNIDMINFKTCNIFIIQIIKHRLHNT